MNAFDLFPADGELVFDIHGSTSVVGKLFRTMRMPAQILETHAEVQIPVPALPAPIFKPLLFAVGIDEELHLHLLELARAENKVSGTDFVAESLTDLRDAEWYSLAHASLHILEIDIDTLRCLRAQVDERGIFFYRTHIGLEHEVKFARLGECAFHSAIGADRRITTHFRHVIGAKAALTVGAVHQRIGKDLFVARSLPHAPCHENAGVEADDIVTHPCQCVPPGSFHVVFILYTKRTVIKDGIQSTIYFTAREDKAASLTERNDVLHTVGLFARSLLHFCYTPPDSAGLAQSMCCSQPDHLGLLADRRRYIMGHDMPHARCMSI